MNRKFEAVFLSVAVLFFALSLLIANKSSEFYPVGLLGLLSSTLLFLGSADFKNKLYRYGKFFLWCQLLLFFSIVSFRLGLLGIVLGVVCFFVLYYTIKYMEE